MKEQQAEAKLYTAIDALEQDEFQTGYQQTKKVLLAHSDITAFIGVNDITAIGAINAIRDLGYEVPNQIAVIGFDNTKLAQQYAPQLSSVDHHIDDRAKLAISTILEDKRKLHSRKIIYEPTLVIRKST